MLEAAPITRVLSLRTGRRICAVPVGHVAEVMRPLPVAPLAGAPDFVVGLAIIRGQPTPVIDLGALLDGKSAATTITDPARYVTIRAADRTVALLVDAVLAIQSPDERKFTSLPPLWRGPHPPAVAALGTLDRELLLVLETARLLPEDAATPSATPGTA